MDVRYIRSQYISCHVPQICGCYKYTSNQLLEVIEVLGIEAVRKALLDELRVVIYFDGSCELQEFNYYM